jgi:carbon storage regulator CsrA
MLILSRKEGEAIVLRHLGLAGEIRISVQQIGDGDRVRLGFEAPDDVHILREELLPFRALREIGIGGPGLGAAAAEASP